MYKAPVITAEGEKTGDRDLPEVLFDGTVHEAAMWQVVKAYLANQRQGTASTKTRAPYLPRDFDRRFFHRLEIAHTSHGCHERADIFGSNDLLFFIELGKKNFCYPALNVGQDLAAVFEGRKIPVDGIEVFLKGFVPVFLDVKDNSADVDTDILFHIGGDSVIRLSR